MTEHTKCPSCGGTGEAGTCDECGGSGWVVRVESDVARLACRNATQECVMEELRIQVERLTADNERLREALSAMLNANTEDAWCAALEQAGKALEKEST